MKKLLISILFLSVLNIHAQDTTIKKQALSAYQKGNYDESIHLFKRALAESANDPDIYYYLGTSIQQKSYDSRTKGEYNYANSEQIFNYLDKAIALDSTYGNAKYSYGVECSDNALNAMKNGNLEQAKHFYKKAYNEGAYPAWLIEFGYNLLISCDQNGILFTGGNADYDVCLYLQLIKDYRTDVTVIPIRNLNSPSYIKLLKEGLEGGVKPVKINLTDEQISNIRPIKWKDTEVSIYYDRAYQRGLRLPSDHKMKWIVEPDMDSRKNYAGSEAGSQRQYLSPQRAMLLQIIQDNYDERKIFFSNACDPFFMGGLSLYTRNRGLVAELLPIKTVGTTILNDYEEMAKLLTKANLKDYHTVKNSDIPKASGILYLYHNSLIPLAGYYRLIKDDTALMNLLKTYSDCLRGVNKEDDEYYPSVLKIQYKKKR